MLKEDIIWPIHRQYRSKTDLEPFCFFSDCLYNSTQFDLQLGYFSSTAINVLSCGFASFLYNGGSMRLIINNILSEIDKDIIIKGSNEQNIKAFDLSNIQLLKSTLDEYDTHFFECIAWLISNKKIDIKVISPKSSMGIVHTKSGLFFDGVSYVGFNGSCNFTQNALLENVESIDAFCSWDGSAANAKIKNNIKHFNNIFNEIDNSINYLNPEDIIVEIRDSFNNKDINDLLYQEKDLIKKKSEFLERPSIKKALDNANKNMDKLIETIESKEQEPSFPYDEGPRSYQSKAYHNWTKNGKKGIFAMATGTGKTITSLNCLYEEYKLEKTYKAVIVVPTIALVEQWKKECYKFNFNKVIIVNSKTNWKNTLGRIQTLHTLGKNRSFIIIVTYASFTKRNFQIEFNKLPEDTLFIADEAHNLGAPSILRILKDVPLIYRIGLSATPERQFGEYENNRIKDFFNENDLTNYTYEYTMYDAINKEPKALCPYRYYPCIVTLTEEEFDQYIYISRQISRLPEPRDKEKQELFEKLCLKRQRIIHKAENKITIFKEILHKEYSRRGNLKYTLVYTPEGLTNNLSFTTEDNPIEDIEDLKLINLFTQAVSSVDSLITVRQFTGDSQTTDRINMLKDFSNGKVEVLTSMKCLDEGVDVPRAELAIFCSSTGNPRQFIQRRGRVLRKHTLKKEAIIYDLIVIPIVSGDLDLYNFEKNEISKELKRVKDFAGLSQNHYESLRVLKPILDYYELNI